MNLLEIARMPASIYRIPEGAIAVHESCLRSYHIASRVRDMAEAGAPGSVIRDFLSDVDHAIDMFSDAEKLLAKAVEALKYVDHAHPETTGSAVRFAIIDKANALLGKGPA